MLNHHSHLPLFLILSLFTTPYSSAYTWPSPQYDALEGLLYEGRRPDGSSMASLVHPCKQRPGTNASIPAEWLRFAFHDMAPYDASTQKGGVDSSLIYELDRPENFGLGFQQTVADYLGFSNKYISRSDVIALGAVFAVATCGGPVLTYKGGRVDTLAAGPFGTPEPQQDIETITSDFTRAGFSQADMIGLTACGHTMGGVRDQDFPQLVPHGPDPSIPNFIDFDTTTAFDNTVVTQYLDGTTQNALVVDSNKTMTSDLKVFSSDGNATMKSLVSPTVFASTCQNLFERMINMVPAGVNLTEPIALLPAKVVRADLSIEHEKLVFKTTFRLTQATNATANQGRNVTMYWCDKNGSAADCTGSKRFAPPAATVRESVSISPITQALGFSLITYNFVVPIDATASISRFWFVVDEGNGSQPTTYANDGSGYVLSQDQLIFVPTLSHWEVNQAPSSGSSAHRKRGGATDGNYTKSYNFVAAVRDSSAPSRVYMNLYDSAITGAPAPLSTTVDFSKNTSASSIGGYSFWSANFEDAGLQLTIDLHADVSNANANGAGSSAGNGNAAQTFTLDFLETTDLDGTPYQAPTTVGTTAVTSSDPSSKKQPGKSAASRVSVGGLHAYACWWFAIASLVAVVS